MNRPSDLKVVSNLRRDYESEHWDEALGELNENNMRRRLEHEGYLALRSDYPPGTRFPITRLR